MTYQAPIPTPHAQQATFTLAERYGARRLIDCGAVAHKGGDVPRDMYLAFIKRQWAEAIMLQDGRWLVRLTPLGRQGKAAMVMRNLAI